MPGGKDRFLSGDRLEEGGTCLSSPLSGSHLLDSCSGVSAAETRVSHPLRPRLMLVRSKVREMTGHFFLVVAVGLCGCLLS